MKAHLRQQSLCYWTPGWCWLHLPSFLQAALPPEASPSPHLDSPPTQSWLQMLLLWPGSHSCLPPAVLWPLHWGSVTGGWPPLTGVSHPWCPPPGLLQHCHYDLLPYLPGSLHWALSEVWCGWGAKAAWCPSLKRMHLCCWQWWLWWWWWWWWFSPFSPQWMWWLQWPGCHFHRWQWCWWLHWWWLRSWCYCWYWLSLQQLSSPGKHKYISNWSLVSCQQQRVTSVWSKSVISKCNISEFSSYYVTPFLNQIHKINLYSNTEHNKHQTQIFEVLVPSMLPLQKNNFKKHIRVEQAGIIIHSV